MPPRILLIVATEPRVVSEHHPSTELALPILVCSEARYSVTGKEILHPFAGADPDDMRGVGELEDRPRAVTVWDFSGTKLDAVDVAELGAGAVFHSASQPVSAAGAICATLESALRSIAAARHRMQYRGSGVPEVHRPLRNRR